MRWRLPEASPSPRGEKVSGFWWEVEIFSFYLVACDFFMKSEAEGQPGGAQSSWSLETRGPVCCSSVPAPGVRKESVFFRGGFPCGSAGKESACNTRDLDLIPGLGRSPGEGKGYPLQYSGLENSTRCIVHGVAKSQT